ncbi:MAG: 16S rRNA (cytosine(967)-C(5))-methyltransferase RsmB [Acidobacteriota bacterium]|nr:16S rRNA (cytosine(967)-C(5))-methyltransferase RsmB [Acidobacteriota bacterium]
MAISPARTAAFDILLRVETEDAYATELLHSTLVGKLSPQDRGLATEIVMGTLRWQPVLDAILERASDKTPAKLDAEVRIALRMALYQRAALGRVPEHAIVNDGVELVKRARKRSAAGFANAVLRKALAGPALGVAAFDPEQAHPAWLVARWSARFGEARARAICAYDQQHSPAAIRVADPALVAELEREGVALAPGRLLAGARRVVSVAGPPITQTRAFKEGRVQIQDEASQLVALLVGRVQPGGRVLDCCAAPGGKTTVIAARNREATIVAIEIHPQRAELTRQRVRAANVEVLTADATKLQTRGGFDRVLADVPCSGTGTLARNPEIKWRLKPEKLVEFHALQVGLLNAALDQLKPGGRLLYSTCSLEREENEDVVEEVLRARKDVELLDARDELAALAKEGELAENNGEIDSLLAGKFLRTLPGVHPCDGFFAAALRRKS